jgi:hypothetical protein
MFFINLCVSVNLNIFFIFQPDPTARPRASTSPEKQPNTPTRPTHLQGTNTPKTIKLTRESFREHFM